MEHKSTVLIVDDEAVGRQTLEGVLYGHGYELAFAGDGAETLAQAVALVPDLILLDVMMPDMDGFEVCRRLRADPMLADVPVIMVTALDDRDSRLRGIEAGADDFITKPFDRIELRARVRTITRLNRYRRLLAERVRFEWVVEGSRDGYLILDQEDTILYANPQARLYLGMDTVEARLRDVFQDPSPGETREEQSQDAGRFLDLARMQYHLEPQEAWSGWSTGETSDNSTRIRYLVRPESSTSTALWLQVDLLDFPAGPEEHRVVCLRDVSAEVTRQRDMRGFHEAVTHKMRTPLTTMLGSLSLLARHGDKMSGEDVLDFANKAVRGAERMRDTVEDILQYLHAAGKAEPDVQFRLGDLRPMAEGMCGDLGIDLGSLVCPEVLSSLHILLSHQATELVMWEILENAQKFHPTHEPRVDVMVSLSAPGQITFEIQDDGRALGAEQIGRMWVPYYQGEKYFTGEATGTGLGLATVAAVVWEVGGTCRARNRADGPGVIIELVLPAEK